MSKFSRHLKKKTYKTEGTKPTTTVVLELLSSPPRYYRSVPFARKDNGPAAAGSPGVEHGAGRGDSVATASDSRAKRNFVNFSPAVAATTIGF